MVALQWHHVGGMASQSAGNSIVQQLFPTHNKEAINIWHYWHFMRGTIGHRWRHCHRAIMMTSSIGNIFRVTGLLCEEFTGHRWIPLTKASDAKLWCFLWSACEQTVEKRMETPVIWDAIVLIMTSLQWCIHFLCHLLVISRRAVRVSGVKRLYRLTGWYWSFN